MLQPECRIVLQGQGSRRVARRQRGQRDQLRQQFAVNRPQRGDGARVQVGQAQQQVLTARRRAVDGRFGLIVAGQYALANILVQGRAEVLAPCKALDGGQIVEGDRPCEQDGPRVDQGAAAGQPELLQQRPAGRTSVPVHGDGQAIDVGRNRAGVSDQVI